MRKLVLGLLLASVCVSVTGCGGCGGALSESDLRRRSRKRAPDEDEPRASAVAQQPAQPANQAPPPGATPSNEPPAAASPSNPPSVPASSPPSPPPAAATPESTGPVRIVVQNAKPEQPLTDAQRRQRSVANLQKIGQALASHSQRTGALPALIVDEQGQPLLSWRVALLPDLGYGELYRQFRLNEPWNSSRNTELAAQIPPEYQSPERFDQKTNYLGLAGSGQAFSGPRGTVAAAMEDGPENTVVIVEVDDSRVTLWTQPQEFAPPVGAPRSDLGRLRADGVFALLGDGKVLRIGPEIADHQLLALLSPDGGEPLVAAELLQPPQDEPIKVAAAPAGPVTTPDPAPSRPMIPPAVAASSSRLHLPGETPPPDSSQVPVPDAEALADARKLFRDLYGKQYEEARTWEEKGEFAKVLLAEAEKVQENPAHYHELLRITREVAAAGGDADSARQAVKLTTQRFQVDAPAMRLKMLDDLSKSPRKTELAESLRTDARELLLDAFDADRFDVALPAFERLLEFTRIKSEKTERAEITRLVQRRQPLEAAKTAYAAACAATEILKTNPDDAAANETLGKYLCFVKNRWDAGLPHLVRAAEVRLRVVATIDMESGRSPQDTLSLADHYWEMAGDFKQPFTRGLHLRAARCYQAAVNQLPGGLEKLKAQKRIDEVGEIYSQEEVSRALAPAAADMEVE